MRVRQHFSAIPFTQTSYVESCSELFTSKPENSVGPTTSQDARPTSGSPLFADVTNGLRSTKTDQMHPVVTAALIAVVGQLLVFTLIHNRADAGANGARTNAHFD